MSTQRFIRILILASSALTPGIAGAQGIALLSATSQAEPPEQVEAATPSSDEPADASDGQRSSNEISDIIVTAQRRSQKLQDVPISISAVTASTLTESGLSTTQDLSIVTPSLTVGQSRNIIQPFIRGVGTQNNAPGDESSIATYVDGVYIPTMSSVNFKFNNIERVEILKGPQGTLFGRNAAGGLIHIITRTPSFVPVLEGSVGYGNYDTVSANAYASAGLSSSVAIDLATNFSDQNDGWGRNLTTGKDVNKNREWGIRSKLLWDPSDRLNVTLAGDYMRRTTDMGYVRQPIPGTIAFGGLVNQGGFYDTTAGTPNSTTNADYGGSIKISLDLGKATLGSLTAYREGTNRFSLDQETGPTSVIDIADTEITKNFQQEVTLGGDLGKLNYTIGGMYLHSTTDVTFFIRSIPIPPLNIDRSAYVTLDSLAAFAQGTYKLTDATSVTAGLRYTVDERSLVGSEIARPGHPLPAGTVINPFTQPEPKFKKVTWRFAVDHRFSDEVMAYASQSRGFKSGAFNTSAPRQAPVRPETLDASEVGIKTDLLSRALQLNLAGFYYKHKDIQLQKVVAGGGVLSNAAAARIYGLEIDAVARPPVGTGKLELRASLSLLDGKYTSFPGAGISVPNPASCTPGAPPTGFGGNKICVGDASGFDTIRTPSNTFSLGADYVIPIRTGEMGLNLTYFRSGGFYWDIDNRVREPSYNLLNARLSYDLSSQWGLALYARNITKEKYFNQVSTSTLGDLYSPGAPRTYGIDLNFKFGG